MVTITPFAAHGEEEKEEAEECSKLPQTSFFSLGESSRAVGMDIVAGCDGQGFHAFILEVLKEEEGTHEVLVRFAPARLNMGPSNMKWVGKKLLRIKSAQTAVGQYLKGKKHRLAVMYGKTSEDGMITPTVAILTASEEEKTFKTNLFKFQKADKFFSPFVFDRKGSLLVLWGEERKGKISIVYSLVDLEAMKASEPKQLAAGDILDRFHALSTEADIFLSWFEESVHKAGEAGEAGEEDCAHIMVEKFDLSGGSKGRIKAGHICNEAVLTGMRLKGQETFVDGMEGRQGKWRPFEIKINADFKEAKISRKKTPAISYDAGFVSFSEVILWKKRHEESSVNLRFFGKNFVASPEGAELPLALSLCKTAAVGGWIDSSGDKKDSVKFFDIILKDSDSDGVLDDFDACPEGATIEGE